MKEWSIFIFTHVKYERVREENIELYKNGFWNLSPQFFFGNFNHAGTSGIVPKGASVMDPKGNIHKV